MTVVPLVRGLQNHSLTITEGSTQLLQFVIHDANPPVQTFGISWFFGNDVRLDLFPNGTVFQGTELIFSDDYLRLLLSDVTYNVSGRITLQAGNAAGQSQDYVDIIVHGKKTHQQLLLYSIYSNVIIQTKLYCCLY